MGVVAPGEKKINYIIIICVNDISAVINYDYGRLQDLFKIPTGTQKDFFEVYT